MLMGILIVVTTLLQVPYGAFIFFVIVVGTVVNDYLPPNNRCYLLALFLIPNTTGF